MKYRNNGGSHALADGTIIKPGQIFESDDANINKNFPNKFTALKDEAPVAPAPVAAPVAVAAPATNDTTPTGDDVTADFPAAGANELTVKRAKDGYWVLDDNDPVNEKALRTKKAVDKAIADYIKG